MTFISDEYEIWTLDAKLNFVTQLYAETQLLSEAPEKILFILGKYLDIKTHR